MFINFFRSSFLIQYAFVFLIAAVLWMPSFINPQATVLEYESNTMLFNVLARLMNQTPRTGNVIAFTLLLVQLFFFNLILRTHKLITRNSSAAAFVFVLLLSITPSQTGFYPFVIVNFLMLLILNSLFSLYDSEDIEFPVFKVAVLASLISLFYFPAVLLLGYIWIVLLIIRTSSSRIWIISLVGFLCPYFFVTSYFYLTDQLVNQITLFLLSFERFSFPELDLDFSQTVIAVFALILVLFFFSLNIVYSTKVEKNIRLRKKIAISTSLFIMGLPMLFFTKTPLAQNSMFFIGAAIIISVAMAHLNKSKFMNIAFIILLVLLFINNYQTLFAHAFSS